MDKSQMTEGQEYTGDKDGGFIVADDSASMAVKGIRKTGVGTIESTESTESTEASTNPMGSLAEASVGQVDIPPDRPKPIDFRGLKASLVEACSGAITKARNAEAEYGAFMASIADISGPIQAIEKLKKQISKSESADQIRELLAQIALLSVVGPDVTMTVSRLLRRRWFDAVLPQLLAVVFDVKAKLNEWEVSVNAEKKTLLKAYGHLGISQALGADQTIGAMRQDIRHLEKLLLEAENDRFHSAPSRRLLANWLGA